MEDLDVIEISLNEVSFTNICKMGGFKHGSGYLGIDVYLTKIDIKNLVLSGKVTVYVSDKTFNLTINNVDFTILKEVLKRTPMYSDLYYDL